MNQNRIGVGIIGAGFIGCSHARAARENPQVELVAIADMDERRGRAAVSEYGGEYYRDYNRMLERNDLDAVIICTPDHLHLEPSVAAANAEKHILLEKPLASTLEDADRILEAAEKKRVRLMVGHSLRFNLPYAHLRDCLRKGDIGEPVHGWARRNARVIDGRRFEGNTSVVLFLAVHDIDFMLWCTAGKVVKVYAESNRKVLKEVGADDSVLSILKFADGFIVSMEHSWVNPENFGAVVDAKVEIVGEKGVISFDAYNQGLISWTESGTRLGAPAEYLGQLRGSIYEQDRHFVECLQSGSEFLVSGQEARETLLVALAIHESLRRGVPVQIP